MNEARLETFTYLLSEIKTTLKEMGLSSSDESIAGLLEVQPQWIYRRKLDEEDSLFITVKLIDLFALMYLRTYLKDKLEVETPV